MERNLLLTPGPSLVPFLIRETQAQEIIHHRTKEFREILGKVNLGLKYVFCTRNPVLILSSSGTGAMEASVSNFLSAKDTVIIVEGGKFGERWKEIALKYNLEVISYKIEWGSAPEAGYIKDLLDNHEEVKAVFTTLCETSTATVYDIESIAKVTKDRDILLVVDAISGLGQDKLLTDEWGVDIVVSGSQKGFMLPPGLGFLSISDKARDFMNHSSLPRYYFDLGKALKSYEKNDTPFTPAISLITGLEVALNLIKREGLKERWEKFCKFAKAVRAAAKALGLNPFSQWPSVSVTAVVSPEKIKSSELVKHLRNKYGVSIAAGQADFKDKIFRIAHMGAIEEQDLVVGFYFLEKALKDLGYKVKAGVSVQKIEEILSEGVK
ncbi:MAG: alanine--glyoxylate aminotransferase family protein [Candidatus Omnitrophica bacterium]|nr:alanine--glyoxylate aminotransferase family protein [Candidatus Omnitrophota bacterium]